MNKNELSIQRSLWHRHNNGTVIPNIYVDTHCSTEVDALHISKSNYVTFYEIKCSESDFKADLKKKRHTQLLKRDKSLYIKPKYFIYICSGFTPKDIPEYAGVYTTRTHHGFIDWDTPLKKPPILWNEKLNQEQEHFINRKVMFRYMDLLYLSKNN